MTHRYTPLLATSVAAHSSIPAIRSPMTPPSVTDATPVDTDPLAEPETAMADGAAPADDDPVTQGDQSSPQARPVTTQSRRHFPSCRSWKRNVDWSTSNCAALAPLTGKEVQGQGGACIGRISACDNADMHT